MQKIAFTIFEIAKQMISKNMPQDEILQIVEHHVKKAYVKALEDLKERKIIDEVVASTGKEAEKVILILQEVQKKLNWLPSHALDIRLMVKFLLEAATIWLGKSRTTIRI